MLDNDKYSLNENSRLRRPLRFCGTNCAADEAAEDMYTGTLTKNQETRHEQRDQSRLRVIDQRMWVACSLFATVL